MAATKSSSPVSESPVNEVVVGSAAPAFELQTGNERPVRSKDLRGNRYVLYFYPKDNTPGCTTEGCDFRDHHDQFTAMNVPVYGVSPDSAAVHQRFANKHEFPFELLADTEKTLAVAYGVWRLKKNYGREYMGIERSTFVVGPTGRVEHVWRKVRVKDHVQQVLAALEE